MWVVVVYPPIVVPWQIERPRACPRCSATAVDLHQRIRRRLPFVDPTFTYSGNLQLVSAYETVRFRCRACHKTLMPPMPERLVGFRLQRHIAARIVTAYCLGDSPESIRLSLAQHGLEVGRSSTSTIYRVLKAVADDELRRLHRINKRRSARASRRATATGRAVAPFDVFHSLEAEVATENGVISDSLRIIAPTHDVPSGRFIDVYRLASVVPLYGNATTWATIHWLDAYLRDAGSAGVLVYQRRAALERDFPPFEAEDDMLRFWESPYEENALSLSALSGPLDTQLPEVQRAIKMALRTVAVSEEEESEGTVEVLRWAGSGDSLVIRMAKNDYIYDPDEG